jgi:hypothetical protein
VTQKRDYRAVRRAAPKSGWSAWNIYDGLGKWTAELRLSDRERGWELLIEPGTHGYSLRQIDTYEAWCRWLALRIVTKL